MRRCKGVRIVLFSRGESLVAYGIALNATFQLPKNSLLLLHYPFKLVEFMHETLYFFSDKSVGLLVIINQQGLLLVTVFVPQYLS